MKIYSIYYIHQGIPSINQSLAQTKQKAALDTHCNPSSIIDVNQHHILCRYQNPNAFEWYIRFFLMCMGRVYRDVTLALERRCIGCWISLSSSLCLMGIQPSTAFGSIFLFFGIVLTSHRQKYPHSDTNPKFGHKSKAIHFLHRLPPISSNPLT